MRGNQANAIFPFMIKTPEDLQLLIARRVTQIRERRGMTREELSGVSGVSPDDMEKFERSGEITLLSLIKIVTALDIRNELEHLYEDVPPMSIEEVIRGQG